MSTLSRHFKLLALVMGSVVLVGCGSEKPGVVELPPPRVTVSKVVVRKVVQRDTYTGRTEAIPSVDIRPRVQGHIQKIHFKDGEVVAKGTPLFDLDPRPFEASRDSTIGELNVYKAQKVAAEKEVARLKELIRRGGASQRQLDKAIADVGALNASIQSTEQKIERHKLDLEYARITAPFAGRLDRARLRVGSLVQTTGPSSVLTTLKAQDPIYVYFDIGERPLLDYQKYARERTRGSSQDDIEQANIVVSLTQANGDQYPHKGVLDFISNTIDPSTGTLRVRARIPNPDHLLLPGAFVTVHIDVRAFQAIQVADRAIGTDQSNKFVYVVTRDNIAKYRKIQQGRLIEGLRVIEAGLSEGEQVIVNGILYVRPDSKVEPILEPMPGLPHSDDKMTKGERGASSP